MKLKYVYASIALIFIIVGLALWKLNDTYRTDKMSAKQDQLQTQQTALRTSLTSQISQLKNTLSTYTVQIDEAKINWVQLKPFYVLAQVQEDVGNHLTILKMFTESGSLAERWNLTTLQQYLNFPVRANQLIRIEPFKDQAGMVHLALVFFDSEKKNNSRTGVMVIGEVSYFQRFFDLQRTSQVTQVLLTADQTVAAHSEFEYVGNASDEGKVSAKNFFVDRQEIRGTNLSLLSYASKKTQSNLNVPISIFGMIVGLGFLISGILVFVAKPEKEIVAKAVEPVVTAPVPTPPKLVAKNNEAPEAVKKPTGIPLVFNQESQIVPIQVQACVQQALFNIDRQIKSNDIVINKEFVSAESVILDYPKFIKVFENVLLNVVQGLTSEAKRKIFIRTYDVGQATTVEIQAGIAPFSLNEAIWPILKGAAAEYVQAASSAGEPIFRFVFTRPAVKAAPQFNLGISDNDNFKPAAPPRFDIPLATVPPVAQPAAVASDLDIDALLSLDEADTYVPEAKTADATPPKIDIEKEMQPSKFKLDQNKISIVEDPQIEIDSNEEQKAEQIKVKIRRPEKG